MDIAKEVEQLLAGIKFDDFMRSRPFGPGYKAIQVPTQKWMHELKLDDQLGFIRVEMNGVNYKYTVVGIAVNDKATQIIYNTLAISD